jgi:hypothetical protein
MGIQAPWRIARCTLTLRLCWLVVVSIATTTAAAAAAAGQQGGCEHRLPC